MTSSHHGDATVVHDLHDGLSEFLIDIDHARLVVDDPVSGHARLLVTDRQFRDLVLCAGDLVPSMLPKRAPAQIATNTRAADNGDPNATLPEGVAGYRMCRQCGKKLAQIPAESPTYCGDECQHNWRQSEYRGWYPR